MDPLATADALKERLQQPDMDADLALQAVTHASGMVRGVARQTFTFVSQETVDLVGNTKVLKLPERPVVVDGDNPLTVVELGDFGAPDLTVLAGRDFERIGSELTRGHPYYFSTRLRSWPWARVMGVWTPRVQVTYSHGYVTIPDAVQSITLDVAQALASNPEGLRQVTIDDYTEIRATEMLGAAQVNNILAAVTTAGVRRGSAFSVRLG
ncbi:hypothetical protein AB0I28_12600 [Phytomonospora sp. NPDC050363]|uniref:hypothetical protein n=1 Tax=Phytomonospora sp. NPDC050363 TaxID=3155642 RepID=UPI0033DAEBFF